MKLEGLWTPPKLVQWIAEDFGSRRMPGSLRLEAERLVSHALGISRLDIYLQYDKPCSPEEQKAVRELVIRRRNREPLCYVLQSSEFWSLPLEVGPGVLIPRPDTEVLIEATLGVIRSQPRSGPLQILELGTGSAAIPLALSMDEDQLNITATDISAQALGFARKNINCYRSEFEKRGNLIYLIQGNRFDAIKQQARFDYLVSNPPYIPVGDIDHLQEEVRSWEPRGALDGGQDGLDFYRYLKDAAEQLLKPGGFLIFEHGFDQRASIQELMSSSIILAYSEAIKDLGGHDRVLIFRKTGS